jgi:hypothetical protein
MASQGRSGRRLWVPLLAIALFLPAFTGADAGYRPAFRCGMIPEVWYYGEVGRITSLCSTSFPARYT